MRIDKLLWYLRFARSRAIARQMAEAGHIRLNGRRIERAHSQVGPGDFLVLPHPSGARAIEILALPPRRGPAPEAQACYRALDEAAPNLIAAQKRKYHSEGDLQP